MFADITANTFGWAYKILDNKYGFDAFNQAVFARGSQLLGKRLWRTGDQCLIDGLLVNGSANSVGRLAGIIRWAQTGFLYHYAIVMMLGLLGMLAWFVY